MIRAGVHLYVYIFHIVVCLAQANSVVCVDACMCVFTSMI